MSQSPRCPACGLPLPENRLAGLCPACTWQGLFESEPELEREAPSREGAFMNIPGYEIIQEIARGGMGIVYRARQKDPGRSVALKMLLPRQMGSAQMAERFRLEVRALTELEHPAILPVYHMGEHEGLPFFTMKLATGGTLAERQGQFAGEWRAIAELMARLAEAVQFAHEHGVLHRDLKPGNILFDDQFRAYVSDFGLAKLADTEEDLTRSVDFLGTPRYVSPEIAERSARHATTASDIYGLGAIFYELLTGRAPFEAETVPALLKKIAEDEPERPSRVLALGKTRDWHAETTSAPSQGPKEIVPRDLEVICLKCLAKEPSGRYASAGELGKDLQRWLQGKPILARPVSALERASKWVRRNPVLGGLTAALLVCLLGGGLVLWHSYRQVSRALTSTQKAETEAQSNLREALLSQAKALGAAHGMGQRWQALQVLAEAAGIRPSLELRNEAAAALARPDLREFSRFPATFGPGGSCVVVFTSDLEKYVAPEPGGGFALRATKDQRLLAAFPGKPALWFVLSPDDRHVAAMLSDYSLEIWNLESHQRLLRWPGTSRQPPAAEFNPDGVSLAGFISGEGLFLQRLDGSERQPLGSTNGWVIFLRFDATGERLAVVREPGGIELWHCKPKPELVWSQPLRKTVPWLAWSPDGDRLMAAADDERGLRILSAANGQTELVYTRHLRYPRQFEFDPSGRTVASVGDDWSLRLWDARTGQDLATGVGRHRVVRFSADGRRLTTAPTDHHLAVLELAPNLVFREFRSTYNEYMPVGMTSPTDGRVLAVYYPFLRLYDTQSGSELPELNYAAPNAAQSAFFEPNSSALLYTVPGKGIYRREFILFTNLAPSSSGFRYGSPELVVSDSKARIGQAIGNSWLRFGDDGLVVWPVRDPKQARKIPVRGLPPHAAVSSDGKWVAGVDSAHNSIVVWNMVSAQVLTNLDAQSPDGVWFSPDSQWLVASIGTGYGTWSTSTWQPGVRWEAHLDSGDSGQVSFSNDSRLLAARQERETFRLFSFPDCRELVTMKPPLVLVVHTSCLSGDGSRLWLSAGGYRVFEWNLSELRAQLRKLGLDWNL